MDSLGLFIYNMKRVGLEAVAVRAVGLSLSQATKCALDVRVSFEQIFHRVQEELMGDFHNII